MQNNHLINFFKKEIVKEVKVCHVVPSINESTGGVGFAATSLAETLAGQGIKAYLFTLNYQAHGKQIIPKGAKIHSHETNFFVRNTQGFHPKLFQNLWELASTELNLIHNHGLWMIPNLYARQVALNQHLPLVISPHGMLEPWSLKHSRIKKSLAWLLYEQKNLKSANIFHATSDEEAWSIRQLNFHQPIAIIPNGVSLPDLTSLPSREVLCSLFPELKDKQWLLFLSRIHPKKGLDNLLKVWQKLAIQFPEWHLIVAGPDSIGYQSKLKLLVSELALQQRVTFTDMLSGEKKAAALGNADLFVLPTHSENFGIAIAEALAYVVPVVTTKGAPWQDLSTYECGWWIENSQEALALALAEGMQMSSSERQSMGLRGRNLVAKKYSWDSIAAQMSSVYRWLLTGGEPPNCVQSDVSSLRDENF